METNKLISDDVKLLVKCFGLALVIVTLQFAFISWVVRIVIDYGN